MVATVAVEAAWKATSTVELGIAFSDLEWTKPGESVLITVPIGCHRVGGVDPFSVDERARTFGCGWQSGWVTEPVRDAYDENAELYASLVLGELDTDTQLTRALAVFAEIAARQHGPVVDLGCGPGHVVDHLCELGVTTIGYDLSPGQIEQARMTFPGRQFHVGDLTALEHPDDSLGGIVSRHSIIHLDPTTLGGVSAEWMRALEPGAPVFVSFFGSRSVGAHGIPFDHKVVTAYELFPSVVAQHLSDAGFTAIDIDATPIPEGGRPFDHAIVLARKGHG